MITILSRYYVVFRYQMRKNAFTAIILKVLVLSNLMNEVTMDLIAVAHLDHHHFLLHQVLFMCCWKFLMLIFKAAKRKNYAIEA